MHEVLSKKNLPPLSIWASLKNALGLSQRPLSCLQVEVSSRCPGRCTYCPHTSQAAVWRSRELSPQTFALLWPLLLKSRRIHLQGWGEPLLNPAFFDFVEVARRADCNVSTTTCGLVMSEELALQIIGSGLDIIAFSLTGLDQANNASRQGVDFARVIKAIKLLQKIRKDKMGVHLEVHLAYLMLASDLDSITRLPELMDELEVHAAVVSTLDYITADKWRAEAFWPDEKDKIAAARSVLAAAARQAQARGRQLYYALPSQEPARDCREHTQSCLYVDAAGQISPCIYLNLPTTQADPKRRVMGALGQGDPWSDIWLAPRYQAFRASLAELKPEDCCLSCVKRFEVLKTG